MALTRYRNKRNFKSTPEPDGSEVKKNAKKSEPPASLRFVIQLHDATRKHYDLRLELDGTMKSWAVPKGPSLDPMERRLAVEVEDHPMDYNQFEGVIPRGNYGAGVVMIWDEGTYKARSIEFPAKDEQDALRRAYAKGHLTILMEGSKLRGEFALIRLARSDGNNWLLVKKHDAFVSREDITHADRSARTGRTLGEIAANAPKEGKLWHSNRSEAPSKPPPPAKKKTQTRAKDRQTLPARFKKKARAEEQLRAQKPVIWKPISTLPEASDLFLHPLYDGYRAQLLIDDEGTVSLVAKTGLSLTRRFPRLVKELEAIKGPLLFDGLIVPLDEHEQPRKRGRADSKTEIQHAYFAYDLLHADTLTITDLSLSERLDALSTLRIEQPALRLVAAIDPKSPESAAYTIGTLIRAPTEPYNGPTHPRTCRGHHHAPRGPSEERQEPNRTVGSRHEVLGRTARPGAPQQVALTHLSKIYWPKEKITKGQLLDYYQNVSSVMLPHLRDRPQSLNRHPNGIEGSSFFQKEVSGSVPGWMETATIGSGRSGKTVTYALCQTESDLLFLSNMGCIEINTWLSRVGSINSPDFIVFDLDPGKISFDSVIDTAKMVKKVLDQIKAPAFCKTSGSRGLHIYVPITGAESFDDGRIFAHQLSQEVHRRLPDITSLERSPDRRRNLIYLDYLQNRIGQTMSSVYSVRPKPNATVSTPLKWSEVKHGLDPGIFTLNSLSKRLDKVGDIWKDILKAAVPLTDCQKALDALMPPARKKS